MTTHHNDPKSHEGTGLSHDDIMRLQREHSPEARADIAQKIAGNYSTGKLNARERELADAIFRLLMHDAEAEVRRALSENLKESHELPHDIAIKLASDISDVAVPMLQCSMVLSEDDLIEIVRSTEAVAVMDAVARRQSVSAELSAALLCRDHTNVWQTLFSNQGAVIPEQSVHFIMERIKGEDSLLRTLITRGDMSLRLAEKLYAVVSDEIKTLLTERYRLTVHLAEENTEEVFELMTLGLLDYRSDAQSMEGLVEELYNTSKLSFSLLIRMLCAGKLRFFEHAMAKLADVPLMNARILILDPGKLGFRSLYDQSGLPQGFYPAVRALLEVALEETCHGRYQHEDYSQRMIERVRAKGYDRSVDHLDYLTAAVRASLHDAPTGQYV